VRNMAPDTPSADQHNGWFPVGQSLRLAAQGNRLKTATVTRLFPSLSACGYPGFGRCIFNFRISADITPL